MTAGPATPPSVAGWQDLKAASPDRADAGDGGRSRFDAGAGVPALFGLRL